MTATKPPELEYMNSTFRIVGLDKYEVLALIRLLNLVHGESTPPQRQLIDSILKGAEHLGITPKMEDKPTK